MSVIASNQLQGGDRIVVQSPGIEDFEATVRFCRGWGLVHGVMDWSMVRDDGSEFVYSLPYKEPCPVPLVEGSAT